MDVLVKENLEKLLSNTSGQIGTFVFEGGVVLGESARGVPLDPVIPVLDQVERIVTKYRVRPIAFLHGLEFNFPGRQPFTWTHEHLLTDKGQRFETAIPFREFKRNKELHDIYYELWAMWHHCLQIGHRYIELHRHHHVLQQQNLAAAKLLGDANAMGVSDRHHALSAGFSPAYFEFDAFVSKARRLFDRVGQFLWRFFPGDSGGCPSSFKDQIRKLKKSLPASIHDPLERFWKDQGKRIRAYRDFVHHFDLLTLKNDTTEFIRMDDAVWVAHVKIPDNPEANSQRKFRYTGRLDALTYSWETCNEILTLLHSIGQQLPKGLPRT